MRALGMKELDWYQHGSRPYEIEWSDRTTCRAETTLVDYLRRCLPQHPQPRAFAQELLSGAKLSTPTLPADPQALVAFVARELPAAHWLFVGQQVDPSTESHQVMNRPGVSVHFDRTHLAVTVLTRRDDDAWADVKHAASLAKAETAWRATLKKFRLA